MKMCAFENDFKTFLKKMFKNLQEFVKGDVSDMNGRQKESTLIHTIEISVFNAGEPIL